MSEYIEVGQSLQFTDPNTPTRVGEIVENVSDIYNIPSPRLGMQVFVKSEKKSYVITSLKSKVIGGVDVPEAAVEGFEPVGAKSFTWNNDTDPSNMNDFVVAGVYDIKGEHTRMDDNLPILNTGGGHSFNARLTVLDSSITGSGNSDDKCITQVLSFSNRLGQGEVYIRTGKGSSLDNLTWEKWSTLQRNVNVGEVSSLDNLIDNGIYSGVLTGTGETFVLVVINNYAVVGNSLPKSISQFKYSVGPFGVISFGKRVKIGNADFPAEWDILNQKEINSMIEAAVMSAANYTDTAVANAVAATKREILEGIDPDKIDSIKDIVAWIEAHGGDVTAIYNAINVNTQRISDEVERATTAEANIKGNALQYNTLGVNVYANKAEIYGRSIDSKIRTFDFPAATTKKAGVMSAEDKAQLDAELNIREINEPSYLNFNDYVEQGIYNVYCMSDAINSPINSTGEIKGRLTVLSTSRESTVITQVLNLNNNEGGEGNIYLRSCQNGEWKPWAKLQTNVEVGLIDQTKMDDLTDNGIYSGILSTTGETFVIICINNYAIAQQVGVHHISHLKYSLVAGTGEVKIEKRTRDAYGFWTEWENIGGGSTLPEATEDILGGVKLGTTSNVEYLPIGNISSPYGSGLGFLIDSGAFMTRDRRLVLKVDDNGGLECASTGIKIRIGTSYSGNNKANAIPLCIGTPANHVEFAYWTAAKNPESVPSIPVNPNQFKLGDRGLELINSSSTTKVIWKSSSNMNDFKTPGVYDIYGERTRQDDNLPILNASSGHSIAARLTVVASTLQPDQVEICITQFLQLSNRVGGDGATYVRTYNENNNGMNGWSAWQKQMGMKEYGIVTDFEAWYPTERPNEVPPSYGMDSFIDNGMYSGIYVDEKYISGQVPSFIETFVLVVINDYAVSSQVGTPRRISQLKYATDTLTGQCTVKKRVGTGSDSISWGDWEEIGGGGSSEVDITDAVKQYGLPTLISQGLAKEGVTYKVLDFGENDPVTFDTENKIFNKLISSTVNGIVGHWDANIKVINNKIVIDTYGYNESYAQKPNVAYYKFIINQITNDIAVSADMTEL